MDSLTQDDLAEINPLDLFCSSIDTLRGTSIDQTIPLASGWSARPTRKSGIISSCHDREEIRRICQRGIPPSLKCSAWIINAVAAVNPDMPMSDCDDFGTFRKARVIGKITHKTSGRESLVSLLTCSLYQIMGGILH